MKHDVSDKQPSPQFMETLQQKYSHYFSYFFSRCSRYVLIKLFTILYYNFILFSLL